MTMRAFVLVVAAATLTPAVAHAEPPHAEYVTPEDAPKDGIPHVLDVSLLGQYARVVGDDKPAGLKNLGSFVTRTRLAVGRSITYCAGLDAEVGGSTRGLVYGVTGYLAGLGARWGDDNTISLCGGVGYDGVLHAVPHAVRVPVELAAAVSLGPVRPIVYLRPSWLVGGGRADLPGAPSGFGKELEAGLVVRLARQHHYWSTANAGGGLAVGVAYRELMDSRYIAFSIGVNLVGAQ